MQIHSSVGMAFLDNDNTIGYTAFRKGSTVFVFNLTADLSNDEHTEPTHCGSLRAEVHFGVVLEHPVTCFVHSEYDNCIEIDTDRKISLDYLIFKKMDTFQIKNILNKKLGMICKGVYS